MKNLFLTISMLIAASFVFTSCDTPAGNNAAGNKTANNANASNANAVVNTAAIEADIKKSITDVYSALSKNDADALDKLYPDNYMLVDLDGSVKTKAQRLAELRSGDVKFSSLVADEITVRVNPEGTGAVSIARATSKSTNKGVEAGGQIRVTTVWSKTKDGWKAVSAQATRITAAAPAKADDKKADEKKADNKAPANK